MAAYFKKFSSYFIITSIFILVGIQASYAYAGLSCSVTTAGLCTGTVLLRMSGSSNAHAELPSLSTAAYASNVVCCSGIAGIGNSCSGNYATIAKLSATTNAHVERSTQTNYGQSACLSDSAAGDQITIGYQTTNCTGYDTTLFSMGSTPTNSHVGDGNAYTNKVCAKIVPQSISFSIDHNAISFGAVTSASTKYADIGSGSSTDTTALSITVSTNAPGGYTVYMQGDPPKKGSAVITAIGGTATAPSAGSKAFGVRAVASGGSGASVAPYNDPVKFAYDATAATATSIAQESVGDNVTTTYAVHAVATIDNLLDSGDYATQITYLVTARF